MPARTRKITGVVSQALVSRGSKSEHRGVVLRTKRGEDFILRRASGSAFRDDALEALAGATITGQGFVAGQTFIMQDWTVIKGKGG